MPERADGKVKEHEGQHRSQNRIPGTDLPGGVQAVLPDGAKCDEGSKHEKKETGHLMPEHTDDMAY